MLGSGRVSLSRTKGKIPVQIGGKHGKKVFREQGELRTKETIRTSGGLEKYGLLFPYREVQTAKTTGRGTSGRNAQALGRIPLSENLWGEEMYFHYDSSFRVAQKIVENTREQMKNGTLVHSKMILEPLGKQNAPSSWGTTVTYFELGSKTQIAKTARKTRQQVDTTQRPLERNSI